MQNGRRRGERREVRLTRRDEVPVGNVEERPKNVAAHTVEPERRCEKRGIDEHCGKHDEQSGQQAPSPTSPERREIDAARTVRVPAQPLPEQDPGDEESREGEEGVERQDAAGREVPGVHRDREPDRQATPTVERRPVRPAGTSRRSLRRRVDHDRTAPSRAGYALRTVAGRRCADQGLQSLCVIKVRGNSAAAPQRHTRTLQVSRSRRRRRSWPRPLERCGRRTDEPTANSARNARESRHPSSWCGTRK